ncbi:hypothetical protein RhoFasGS6_03907 [Rhodococcus fascians]|uniref:hypothetical protein n=1 Tax=Rhodococcoides fascians TaxID=1828 RepID=UPI001427A77E|nr:hypothetical protein [Rhodococcus fascians]
MSSPNQPNPNGSATQGGLSSWASKTAAQRKAETTAPVKNSLETNFFGSWISNMFGGFLNGVLGLISALVFGLKGISGGLIDLTGALKATDQKADTAVNTANGAAQTVVTVQKEVVQKFAVFDIRSPTPGYVAINGTEWPSIPHSDLEMGVTVLDVGTFAETGDSNGKTPHAHRMSHVHPTALTAVPEKQLVATQQWFAFIRVPVDTALSGLNFYARGTPTDLRTRVYSVSPTGDLTALTPESGNLAGLLVNTQHTSTPTNFNDALVEAGTWVAVRFRVVGTVYIAGKEKFAPERPQGFYPRQLNATTALASGTPSPDAITEQSLTWPTYPSGFVPYVAVGNNIVVSQPKRFFEDNFDRADSNVFGVGGKWSNSLGIGIRANDLAYTTDSDGSGYALYSQPLTTDYQLHGCRVGLLPDPEKAQVAFSALMFRCTQNRSTGLRVAFRRGAIILQTIVDQTTFSNLVSTTRPIAVTDSIQAQQGEWVNEVFYPDRVLVFHNGVEIIRTDVPPSVVPYGPQRRYGGLGLQRTPFQNSPRIMDWFESDISEVEPAA